MIPWEKLHFRFHPASPPPPPRPRPPSGPSPSIPCLSFPLPPASGGKDASRPWLVRVIITESSSNLPRSNLAYQNHPRIYPLPRCVSLNHLAAGALSRDQARTRARLPASSKALCCTHGQVKRPAVAGEDTMLRLIDGDDSLMITTAANYGRG